MNTFRIALPDNKVQTADIKDEVIDSRYPSPKINTKANPPHVGIVYINWATAGLSFALGETKIIHQFPHGYDYVPSTFGVFSFDDGTNRVSGTLPFQFGSLGYIILEADVKNVYIKYFSVDAISPSIPVPQFTFQVRFYVMAERGFDP